MQKVSLIVVLLSLYLLASCNDVNQNNGNSGGVDPEVNVHISAINNDTLFIEYTINQIKEDSLIFRFPYVIPGSYRINNSDDYITGLNCFDKESNALHYKRMKGNSYMIYNSSNLSKISYSVRSGDKDNEYDVLTKFVASDSYRMINPISLIGYFDTYKDIKHSLELIRPESYFTCFQSEKNEEYKQKDVFEYVDYQHLVDNPLLYGQLDTSSISIDGVLASISVYSDNSIITADLLKSWISPLVKVLDSHTQYTRDRAVPYRFAFVFSDDIVSGSALEQRNASTYCLKANWDTLFLKSKVQHLISHEFLHTITPIKFHSSIYKPELYVDYSSMHLWLYEGVVEYLSLKSRLEAGVISPQKFIYELIYYNTLNQKSENCKNESILTLSSEVISMDEFDCFGKFYCKGALLAFLLDYSIINCSSGEDDLIGSLNRFINNNGDVFKEEAFIDHFVQSTCLESFDLSISDIELEKHFHKAIHELGFIVLDKEVWRISDLSNTFYLEEYSLDNGDYILSFNANSPIGSKNIAVTQINNTKPTKESINIYLVYPPNRKSVDVEYVYNKEKKSITLKPSNYGMMNSVPIVKENSSPTPEMVEFSKLFFN